MVLTSDWGNDVIQKFQDGVDKIQLPDGSSFSDLTIAKDGANTLISLGKNSLSLEQVEMDLIDQTDFTL